ncbi:phytanoyl-CoA dioxygenase family protein [Streptomyces sp. NPDC051362]|uniref:phytanoyl-CoA dioxygenase family protein n=1 Tax=Streptomyces sp. NPDC051362 TaxID=3365651 RepID=UPI0037AC79A0
MSEMSDKFKRIGYVTDMDVLTRREAEGFLAKFERFIVENGIDLKEPGYRLHDRHLDVDFIWDLATHPRVLGIVRELVGEDDVIMLNSRFICKTPGGPKAVPWHCDASYAGLDPAEQVIVWIALDDVNDENGCLRFLPNSLIPYGSREHVRPTMRGGTHVSQELPVTTQEEGQAFSIHMKRGNAVAFDGRMVHSSRATSPRRRRYALALRYIGGNIRLLHHDQWAAVQVGGDGSRVDNDWIFTRESARGFTYAPPKKFDAI